MSGQRVVDPGAVEKSTFRLGISARDKATGIPGWMKHQAATSAKNIGIQPGYSERKAYNHIGRGCVHVGLNSRDSASREIPLRIAVVAVVRFAGKPAIEVITVPNKKPAGICGCTRDPLAASYFPSQKGGMRKAYPATQELRVEARVFSFARWYSIK
jgi:hypothetical protein